MSTVYIGHAVGDENGRASGGDAGNQNGKELRTSAWYLNPKGWRVFRAKDRDTARRIAEDMRRACKNMNIGYDQWQRGTLYAAASLVEFDCSRVDTPCETDCSALVRVCLAYAGIRTANFNTVSEPARLIVSGKFIELTDDKYTKGSAFLMEGDILVTRVKGHTCVVLNDGDKAEREPEPVPPKPTGQVVKVVGRSVRVRMGDNANSRKLFTAHKGEKFPYRGTAPSGWYEIEARGGTAFITSKEAYTRLV